LNNLRVLAFAESFVGLKSSDLDAHIFEEYHRLGEKINLTVIAEQLPSVSEKNIQLVKVPKISRPVILENRL